MDVNHSDGGSGQQIAFAMTSEVKCDVSGARSKQVFGNKPHTTTAARSATHTVAGSKKMTTMRHTVQPRIFAKISRHDTNGST